MPASVTDGDTGQRQAPASTACYIYGIVPADGVRPPSVPGVGQPPARVGLLRHRSLAALVSEIDPSRPLGTPDDLLAHQRLLDEVSAASPVLPLRFGGVVTGPEAVTAELLGPHHDEFADALDQVAGQVQYVIRGRYEGPAVLAEILAEEPEAARLHEEIRGQDETATRPARVQLGEIIGNAVAAKREADTEVATQVLAPLCTAAAVRDPGHEFDAVNLAVLVHRDRQAELEQEFDRMSRDWAARVQMRLLGPMAPYDFVVSPDLGD